ncbi:hypothetical protein ACFVVQ_25165 [Paenibacillus chitinolyticus]|uniref:hypothetical protein n=1 Tax=Paenibacillus chitinolyticus TaxID=79263 RepID=UPI003632E5D2
MKIPHDNEFIKRGIWGYLAAHVKLVSDVLKAESAFAKMNDIRFERVFYNF